MIKVAIVAAAAVLLPSQVLADATKKPPVCQQGSVEGRLKCLSERLGQALDEIDRLKADKASKAELANYATKQALDAKADKTELSKFASNDALSAYAKLGETYKLQSGHFGNCLGAKEDDKFGAFVRSHIIGCPDSTARWKVTK